MIGNRQCAFTKGFVTVPNSFADAQEDENLRRSTVARQLANLPTPQSGAKKKQSTVPHPFRVTLRYGCETRNL
jgi:hypothetical protein